MFVPPEKYVSENSAAFKSSLLLIGIFVVIKISIHLFTITNYGFHRDELLYLAVSERMTVFRNEFPPRAGSYASPVDGAGMDRWFILLFAQYKRKAVSYHLDLVWCTPASSRET
jgi:hypothetical protein